MAESVVDLAHAEDAGAFGNKAAGLAALVRNGIAVPPGFAIAADVARRLADDAGARDLVRAALAPVGFPVAVRSSGTDEDSDGTSFAGQYRTVLNVRSEDAMWEAIGAVRRSSLDCEEYRRRLGVAREARVGVVVQRLVPADTAGVCFTIHPVTGADVRLVSAAWGLGEAVVQGLVIPDQATLRRGGELLNYEVGRKHVLVRSAAGGETETVPVDAPKVLARCLRAAELAAIEAAASQCEAIHRGPLDLEWAFHGAQLFLLQCRPVTT